MQLSDVLRIPHLPEVSDDVLTRSQVMQKGDALPFNMKRQ